MRNDSLYKAIIEAKGTKAVSVNETALLLCIEEGSERGLEYVIELLNLIFNDTDDDEYNKARIYACVVAIVHWEEEGLTRLMENTLCEGGFFTDSIVAELLAHIAGASLESYAAQHFKEFFPNLYERLNLQSDKYSSVSFIQFARQSLISIAINSEPESPIPTTLSFSLGSLILTSSIDALASKFDYFMSRVGSKPVSRKGSKPAHNLSAFNNLFCAFMSRWFRINNNALTSYTRLIKAPEVSEEEVQQYLANHPYILEPFYASIWPKVSLGESLIADFLIRKMDDTYVVVEIEKPTDAIINKNGDLSAKTNHAVRQALEYRDWIASNQLYAKQRFENIWRPSSLVVIGMESSLTTKQTERLKQENESRHGIVKIVGFDWLHHRAESIQNNIINHSFDRFETNRI